MPVAHRQTLVAPTGPLLLYVSLPLLALPRSESYPVTDVPLSQGQSTQAHPLPALATRVMHPPASAHSCGRSNNCLETELKTQTRLSGGWGEVLWQDSRSSLPFAVPLQCISDCPSSACAFIPLCGAGLVTGYFHFFSIRLVGL